MHHVNAGDRVRHKVSGKEGRVVDVIPMIHVLDDVSVLVDGVAGEVLWFGYNVESLETKTPTPAQTEVPAPVKGRSRSRKSRP
jgi:hypothetical protein